jgi:hypothetical protein
VGDPNDRAPSTVGLRTVPAPQRGGHCRASNQPGLLVESQSILWGFRNRQGWVPSGSRSRSTELALPGHTEDVVADEVEQALPGLERLGVADEAIHAHTDEEVLRPVEALFDEAGLLEPTPDGGG